MRIPRAVVLNELVPLLVPALDLQIERSRRTQRDLFVTVTRLIDLAAAAPAFSIARASNVDTVFIRCVGGGGRNIGFGGRAGVYLNNRLRDFLGTQVQAQGMLRQYAVELTGAF